MKKTSESLIEKYNTFTRRPTVLDPSIKNIMYKSFRRSLSVWLPNNKDLQILDIACGEGSLLCFLKDNGFSNLAGFDLSEENVRICHCLSLDFVVQFDALDVIQYRLGQSYDLIFLLDILEHIPKQSASDFLKNVGERLNSGGVLIIQTPNMGSICGIYHRYNDLTHEFGVTEKSIRDLLLCSGFDKENIDVRPAWNATTPIGYLREIYLRLLHFLYTLGEDSSRPKIPTKNLLIRVIKG
ncbi:MAG: class I SAM-dependent methyltransferase [Pelolinea sp.]|nr:class I SAM-dependent methyltransferase [Pelolinea sp.]